MSSADRLIGDIFGVRAAAIAWRSRPHARLLAAANRNSEAEEIFSSSRFFSLQQRDSRVYALIATVRAVEVIVLPFFLFIFFSFSAKTPAWPGVAFLHMIRALDAF